MLSTEKALDLYTKLAEFVPDHEEYSDSFKFTGKIIHNIKESGKYEAFGESLLLMFPETTLDDLAKLSGTALVTLFTQGLSDNKFLLLAKFCRSIGYG